MLLGQGFNTELFHLFVQRRSVNTQLIGSNVSVPIVCLEHLQDDSTLRAFERFTKGLMDGCGMIGN